jgi:hypothetical protein
MDQELRTIEQSVFAELRKRYQLIHDVRRSSSSEQRVEQVIAPVQPAVSLSAPIGGAVRSFTRHRVLLAALGSLVAGALGSLFALGPGTLAGVAVGSALSLLVTRAALERRAVEAAHAELALRERALLESVRQRSASVRAGLEQALDHSLGRVIIRFGRFIAEPLEAEQQEIDRQRESLATLEQLRSALGVHDLRLLELTDDALRASIGLCR